MNFGIIPGMSCWNEMPEKYKKEYFKDLDKDKDKPINLYIKNQEKLDKMWLKELKKEELEEKSWLDWMEY